MKFKDAVGGLFLFVFCASGPLLQAQMTDVLTYHNDNTRDGQTLHEEILKPSNVNSTNFGLLHTLPVDGLVDGQPLYAAGVAIPGVGLRNVLYIVTEHDSVYAFNADGTNIFWKVSMLASNETTSEPVNGCSQVPIEIGITATPVIDRLAGSNGTMFVVAMSKKNSTYIQRIHALDLATGQDLVAPTTVAATYPGTGDNSSGGEVVFDPKQYKERCGLLLLNGLIYTTWASHCDIRPYTGWIMSYDEQTLTQQSVLNITPNGYEAAFWGAGAGMAADAQGNIYALAGNGLFDTNLVNGFPTNGDFGNSYLKYSTSNGLMVADYFCMSNTMTESGRDLDLGSGGCLLLPDMTDSNGILRQLSVGGGKDMILYLVDRNNMGHFSSKTNAIWQQVNNALGGGFWSMPAYWNNYLYTGTSGDNLRAFSFANARLSLRSVSQSAAFFGYPGATPSVSANGTNAGIVWATANTSPMTLYAYNAANLTNELYDSNQAGSRDHSGAGNKYITPTIASARVYVGENKAVGVFGLLNDSTLTPLQAWRDTNFGNPSNVGAGADNANPSGDGVPNLVKYALGLDPFAAVTTNQLPVGSLETNNGSQYLTLTVNRAAAAPDVSYIVEVSGDLTNWVADATNTVVVTNTPTQLIVQDAVPVPSASERFIRLVITSP